MEAQQRLQEEGCVVDINPIIISVNLSEHEENKLLNTPKKHHAALDILLMILRAVVSLYAITK